MCYRIHAEPSPPPRYPLLLCLHGRGETGELGAHDEGGPKDYLGQIKTHGPWSHLKSNTKVLPHLKRFYRVGPHIAERDGYWNVDELVRLIDDVRSVQATTNELFIVGMSRGGLGALELIAKFGKDLGVTGAAVFCPQNANHLAVAATIAPIYVFHGESDSMVPLSKNILAYENAPEKNFRWVKIAKRHSLSKTLHNCWTNVFAQPALYQWFNRLAQDPNYRHQPDKWPKFAALRAK